MAQRTEQPTEQQMDDTAQLCDDIEIFIEFSVADDEQQAALATLENYRDNSLALQVMRDFYARLPELRQEAILKIFTIVSRQAIYLVGVDTQNYQYLYFHNGEELLYLGEKKDGIGDTEVLHFFGYSDENEFLQAVDERSHGYVEPGGRPQTFCPVCTVAEGETHLLGCPVEVCPWCDGQLNMCNCRFEKLGVEEMTDNAEIDRLEVLLEEKGRIPFAADHAPAYPSGGERD
ncbi:MAG: hypothetical protein ABR512_12085 [Desulfopila sp.]